LPVSAELGRSFGSVADVYDRVRPPYSQQLLDRAQQALELDASARVLDLAAGTGRLTRELRLRFEDVVAVEPDERMRAVHGTALAGSAEAIPLPDASVDAVFVGEAFHWFDFEQAFAEIRRVARCGLAILDRSWGFKEQPGLLPQSFQDDIDAVWAGFHGANRVFPDWEEVVQPDGAALFAETLQISGRDLVDLHLTASTPASISHDERRAIAHRAYPLMDDAYDLRVVTYLHWKSL
jgi:SAM-dependent methyltransferase